MQIISFLKMNVSQALTRLPVLFPDVEVKNVTSCLDLTQSNLSAD
jgi:hypothetical protein